MQEIKDLQKCFPKCKVVPLNGEYILIPKTKEAGPLALEIPEPSLLKEHITPAMMTRALPDYDCKAKKLLGLKEVDVKERYCVFLRFGVILPAQTGINYPILKLTPVEFATDIQVIVRATSHNVARMFKVAADENGEKDLVVARDTTYSYVYWNEPITSKTKDLRKDFARYWHDLVSKTGSCSPGEYKIWVDGVTF